MGDREQILKVDACESVLDMSLDRPRAVSFHLPETHDEKREEERDAKVPACRLQPDGECTVSFEEIVITRKDGTKVLITESEAKYLPSETPASHFRFIKIFAFIGALMFPPIGIPGVFVAFRAQMIYKSARKSGDTKGKSARTLKLAERLIILAIVCGLLLWGILLLVLESWYSSHNRGNVVKG